MPWPVEEPTGENPPDGAIINYYLKAAAKGPVTLDVVQQDGRLVRRYSSEDQVTPIPEAPSAPVPLYWYRRPQILSAAAGMHRFIWDVHYQSLPDTGGGGAGFGRGGLPIQAIPHNTAASPTTPWVAPGTYTLKLTVDGAALTQPIVVKQDPRVKTAGLTMQTVYTLTKEMYFGARDAHEAAVMLGEMRQRAEQKRAVASGAEASALEAFIKNALALEGRLPPAAGRGGGPAAEGRGRGGRGAGAEIGAPDTLWGIRSSLAGLMNAMQAADVAPTANTLAAVNEARARTVRVMARWRVLQSSASTLRLTN
jgi:hypothetical protein